MPTALMTKQRGTGLLRQEPITEADTNSGSITVKALLLTEGEFQGGDDDQPITYTADEIKKAAEASQALIDRGDEIPLFNSSHGRGTGYRDEDIVGRVHSFSVETIGADNLPDERFSDLYGKAGLFGLVTIWDPSTIGEYQARAANSMRINLSIGIYLDDFAIFEVSRVPWGAVRGAMLMGRRIQSHALTIAGAKAERTGSIEEYGYSESLMELCYLFTDVVNSIRTTTDEELAGRDRQQLLEDALRDYSDELAQMLGISTAPPPVVFEDQSMPTKDKSTLSAPVDVVEETPTVEAETAATFGVEDIEAMRAEIDALKAELAEQKALSQTQSAVLAQKARAQALVQELKMPPAKFNALFPPDKAVDDLTRQYAVATPDNPLSGPLGLIRLSATIDAYQEMEPVQKAGSVLDGNIGPNPTGDTSVDDKAAAEYAKAFLSTHRPTRKY